MSDYQKIARAIQFIHDHVREQPSLAEIAAQVHLSEYHFHRLFSRWAGVTPKRFLQVLTLERAKTALRQRTDAALAVGDDLGLSSGSRLYDHFLQLEGVTPSQFRRGGEGLAIDYGCHSTPFGEVFIATTPRGICRLEFLDGAGLEPVLQRLRGTWPRGRVGLNSAATGAVVRQLFAGRKPQDRPLSLWVQGTNFQISVWRALLAIPAGSLSSYGEIARQLGNPAAQRAVGRAVGANPVALLIPCHRVIRQCGELGGYRWGPVRKHAILAREAAAVDMEEIAVTTGPTAG